MKKHLILTLALTIAIASNLATIPTLAVSCPPGSARGSANTLPECNIKDEGDELMPAVGVIISALIGIVGVIAVFMIIIGGILFATSQGDPSKTKKARDAIIFGVIGMVIALLAFAILYFVLDEAF